MCANTSSAVRCPNLLDHVSEAARLRHLSYGTEQTYVAWVKRFVLFQAKRHPRNMGKKEVEAFLTHLAVDRQVAAAPASKNQALASLSSAETGYPLVLSPAFSGIDLSWLFSIPDRP